MPHLRLHHVSLPVRDLARAAAFYEGALGLERLERPGFGFTGLWYACGDGQLHLIVNPEGSYRSGPVTGQDAHFALATADFDGALSRLEAVGYSAETAPDDPRHLRVKRDSDAGFAQVFLMDPDGHLVEINRAP
ncbi:VOC family protein [Maliponia aquimaris]|uniref:Glutathione transferase FosA n=1 Tax=Maliponia aquimaris TaxID=1673631 RepID=A0A238KDA0_9RHOB|nr:VOC family protein [Maliponia aquimaris]SMX40828.1 Glutathione transferase FosA [Maliponia aquimaris]